MASGAVADGSGRVIPPPPAPCQEKRSSSFGERLPERQVRRVAFSNMKRTSVPKARIQGESDNLMMDEPRSGMSENGDGAWGRIRTTDTRIFNPLLYQLSYPGAGSASRERRL